MKRKRENEFKNEHSEQQFFVIKRCIPNLNVDLIHLVNKYAERQDDDIQEDLKHIEEKKTRLEEELFERKLRINTRKLIDDIKCNPTTIYLFNYKSLTRRPYLKDLADELISLTVTDTKGEIHLLLATVFPDELYLDPSDPRLKWIIDPRGAYDCEHCKHCAEAGSQHNLKYFEIDPKDLDPEKITSWGITDQKERWADISFVATWFSLPKYSNETQKRRIRE